MARYPLRPRFAGFAGGAIAMGAGLVAWGAVAGAFPLAAGLIGVATGGAYLLSPTWRLTIVTDERGLSIEGRASVRLRLAWDEVVRVIASPSTHTCFIDGGAPERRVMVPGDGAPAPYMIAERAALYAEVLAAVAADKVELVERISDRMT